jgi:hypothetical protein
MPAVRADPEVLNPALATAIQPGMVADTGKYIFCDEQLRTPLVTKKQLASMSFLHFASTPDGKAEMYYTALQGAGLPQNEKEALVVIRLENEDKVVNVLSKAANEAKVANMLPSQFSKLEMGNAKTIVNWDRIKCEKRKFVALKTEFYNASNGLSNIMAVNPSKGLPWNDFIGLAA